MRRSGFKRVRRGAVLLSGMALWVGLSAAPGPASSLTMDQLASLGATDVSEPVQSAVTKVVGAFQSFELAASSLANGADETESSAVMTARESLLDAAMALEATVAAAPLSTAAAVAVGPCAFDLVGMANTYTVDCPLIIDVGGDDTYTNNAGGANGGAAALIDLAGRTPTRPPARGPTGAPPGALGSSTTVAATMPTRPAPSGPMGEATSSGSGSCWIAAATTGTRRDSLAPTVEAPRSGPES